jgi:hypothetical protein
LFPSGFQPATSCASSNARTASSITLLTEGGKETWMRTRRIERVHRHLGEVTVWMYLIVLVTEVNVILPTTDPCRSHADADDQCEQGGAVSSRSRLKASRYRSAPTTTRCCAGCIMPMNAPPERDGRLSSHTGSHRARRRLRETRWLPCRAAREISRPMLPAASRAASRPVFRTHGGRLGDVRLAERRGALQPRGPLERSRHVGPVC